MNQLTAKSLIKSVTEKLAWQDVPKEAVRLARLAHSTYSFIKENYHKLPSTNQNYGHIWYNPDYKCLYFNLGPSKDLIKLSEYKNILQNAPNLKYLEYDWIAKPDTKNETWIPFKFYKVSSLFKQSVAPPINPNPQIRIPETPNYDTPQGTEPIKTLGKITGFTEGPVADVLGGPSTLSATLGGGLLGAGLGYTTGTLLEHLFPERYVERGRARKTLGLLGGLTGSVPGLWWGLRGGFNKESEDQLALIDILPKELELNEMFNKSADSMNAEDFQPSIHADMFNQVLWSPNDQFTPSSLRAAAGGLVTGASAVRESSWVSPADIARVAQGGVTGILFGRAAGALFGLKPKVQDKLMEMGAWTSVLKNTVPPIFS